MEDYTWYCPKCDCYYRESDLIHIDDDPRCPDCGMPVNGMPPEANEPHPYGPDTLAESWL